MEYKLYTDASIKDNLGCICGVIIKDDKVVTESLKSMEYGSIALAELHAVLLGINRWLHTGKALENSLTVYTDSNYVVTTYERLIGEEKSERKYKYMEDIAELYMFLNFFDIKIEKVKAHDCDKWNNYVDEMVRRKVREEVESRQ